MDQALIDAIANDVSNGMSLRAAREAHGLAPGTLYRWMDSVPSVADQISRARERGCEVMLGELVEIADSEPDPQRARVKIDARIKYLEKLMPHRYGQRIELDMRHSINPTALHAEAMERMRLIRDQAPQLIPQVIEGERVFTPDTSDKQSLDGDSDPGNVWD